MRSSTDETAPAGAEAEAGRDIRICDLVSPDYIGVRSLEARGWKNPVSSPGTIHLSMLTRVGGWLFRHRTAIPLPIALAILLIPPSSSSVGLVLPGLAFVLLGELLRLSAVRHIGTISRTRTDRLGPLIASGPFGWVRNPLYIGNIALWVGLALAARLPWLVLPIAALLAIEYHAIVRWEEGLLTERLGQSYRDYLTTVPRWLPRPPRTLSRPLPPAFSWRETLFSERGTLIAIVVGFGLLWLKSKV